MMGAGVTVTDECINEFAALRMKRAHRYIIMKPSEDKTQIVLEKLGARDASFDQFKDEMPKDQCR